MNLAPARARPPYARVSSRAKATTCSWLIAWPSAQAAANSAAASCSCTRASRRIRRPFGCVPDCTGGVPLRLGGAKEHRCFTAPPIGVGDCRQPIEAIRQGMASQAFRLNYAERFTEQLLGLGHIALEEQ